MGPATTHPRTRPARESRPPERPRGTRRRPPAPPSPKNGRPARRVDPPPPRGAPPGTRGADQRRQKPPQPKNPPAGTRAAHPRQYHHAPAPTRLTRPPPSLPDQTPLSLIVAIELPGRVTGLRPTISTTSPGCSAARGARGRPRCGNDHALAFGNARAACARRWVEILRITMTQWIASDRGRAAVRVGQRPCCGRQFAHHDRNGHRLAVTEDLELGVAAGFAVADHRRQIGRVTTSAAAVTEDQRRRGCTPALARRRCPEWSC